MIPCISITHPFVILNILNIVVSSLQFFKFFIDTIIVVQIIIYSE